jgi:hypothetical protein
MWTVPRTWTKDGAIDISDWQRIEDNTRWIAEFYGIDLQYKTWQHTSWPTPSEVARIESNINALLEQTHSFQEKFDWNLLNDIESLLQTLHERVVELQLSIRHAGTFSAGQQIYIPTGGVA